MPLSSTASDYQSGHDSDDPKSNDQADAGVWKRRYFVLQENVNAQTVSKRKAE